MSNNNPIEELRRIFAEHNDPQSQIQLSLPAIAQIDAQTARNDKELKNTITKALYLAADQGNSCQREQARILAQGGRIDSSDQIDIHYIVKNKARAPI
ncbi:MAG: hypothetical protein CMH26_01780 [Micavibrio sp.]|nr:hypothetical protein [Micavibrio sp.]|tara:strand:- start:1402 stop:1695 length:294 start_codon:yes stop_codon:yes gene_type:complete